MTLLSVKTYAVLLWVLLAVESMNVSNSDTRNPHVSDVQTTTWNPGEDDSVTENFDLIVETQSTVILRTPAAPTNTSGLHHNTTAVTTTAEGDAHSHSAAITERVKPTNEPSASTFINSSASAASSPQPTSISDAETTSTLSSTTRSLKNLSSTSASPTTLKSPTSESIPGFDHTFSTKLPSRSLQISATTASQPPATTASGSASISTDPPKSNGTTGIYGPITSPPPTATSQPPDTTASTSASISSNPPNSTNTTEIHPPITSPPVTASSQPPKTTASSSASISTDPPTSTASNSTGTTAVLIPRQPKTSPPPTTTSTTPSTTSAPCQVPKDPPRPEDQPCSTRGAVKPCLIAIAVLAGIATIFMVTTIVLCTKLSARKYKVRKPQPATEMMCISSLLPETTSTRQRNRVPNGILVFPTGADSDEDGGDNLTLSSFLPENDRYV